MAGSDSEKVDDEKSKLSRRRIFEFGSAALAAAATLTVADAQETSEKTGVPQSSDHNSPNEQDPGPKSNTALDAEANPEPAGTPVPPRTSGWPVAIPSRSTR